MRLLLLRYVLNRARETPLNFSAVQTYISATMLFVSTHIILFSTNGHFVARNNCRRMITSNEHEQRHSR